MMSFISNLDKVFCKKSFKFYSLVAVASLSIGLGVAPNMANAQTVGPGCDPEFMAAMQKKGWMEAQREIMIAQATIAKPDSVFALGCFDSFYNSYKGTVTFHNSNGYANSSVQNSVNNYVGAAFSGQRLGGGHYTGGAQNTVLTTCGAMMSLWNVARCSNLDLPSKLLDTLQDIKNYDRGAFPTACAAPTGFGSTGSATTPLGTFYGSKVTNKSVGANFDDMNLFTSVTAPRSVAGGACAKGIPTGVLINTSGSESQEVVCPNPGCVSDGTGNATTPPKCCDSAGANCSS